MNKKISISIFSLFLAGLILGATSAGAQNEGDLPSPGTTPDSFFYFFERISEEIGTLFTFGDLNKAERYAELASERIAEARAVIEKEKPEAAEKAFKRYEDQIAKALVWAEKAKNKGESTAQINETMAENTSKHILVLEGVLDKVPEEAKESINRAKEVSANGQKNALRALSEENPEKATQINLRATEAKLNRAKTKAQEGKTEEAEEAIKEFREQYKFGEEISQIAQGLNKDTTTVEQLVGKATSVHLEVLADVYEMVPEEAKQAIEDAMKTSTKGHGEAVQSLKQKGALNGVPEEAPVSDKVSEEVRERIQEKIKNGKQGI